MENIINSTETKKFYGRGLPHVDVPSLKGKLIVVEGSDGSGRTTQIIKLRDWLESFGFATAEVGLTRSTLVGKELTEAKESGILYPITLTLFYATDLLDQLEHKIIPALRSGFIVLADRYIYTLMARAIVRGANEEWLKDVYSVALVPDAVYYLDVASHLLAERNFHKNGMLDYWEAGMDLIRANNVYESFIQYQRKIRKQYRALQKDYGFQVINANHSADFVSVKIRQHLKTVLNIEEKDVKKSKATPWPDQSSSGQGTKQEPESGDDDLKAQKPNSSGNPEG